MRTAQFLFIGIYDDVSFFLFLDRFICWHCRYGAYRAVELHPGTMVVLYIVVLALITDVINFAYASDGKPYQVSTYRIDEIL